jgi:hypothetical protein
VALRSPLGVGHHHDDAGRARGERRTERTRQEPATVGRAGGRRVSLQEPLQRRDVREPVTVHDEIVGVVDDVQGLGRLWR